MNLLSRCFVLKAFDLDSGKIVPVFKRAWEKAFSISALSALFNCIMQNASHRNAQAIFMVGLQASWEQPATQQPHSPVPGEGDGESLQNRAVEKYEHQ